MLWLACLFNLGCSAIPISELQQISPAEARAYGVDVADGASPTGQIISAEFRTLGGIRKQCVPASDRASYDRGFTVLLGCAVPAGNGRYRIYHSDWQCVARHEAAHALYETDDHTPDMIRRWLMGDRLAACPSS